MTRILWLARSLPFPMIAGDRIYSGRLAAALAEAGAEVAFLGFASEEPPPAGWPNMAWHAVPGAPLGRLRAMASPLPLGAAQHATPAYREAVRRRAAERWDAVVIDYANMGWALAERPRFGDATFVFVTHNHEAGVADLQWRDRGASPVLRAFLWQNFLKMRALETRVARQSDLITAITDGDAAIFGRMAPGRPVLHLPPGYGGVRSAARAVPADRAVILFGSYRWAPKQASLRLFLEAADPVLAAAGIEIRVVGDMPEELRASLAGRYRAARFVGFVDDPAPHLAGARLAVLAEPIGGGFKMKLLEYVFKRVPVAALSVCVAGLPQPVQDHMLVAPDLDALLPQVVAAVGDAARLGAMAEGAYAAASGAFEWADRGRLLLGAIKGLRGGGEAPAALAA